MFKPLIFVASVVALMNPGCRNKEAEDADALKSNESTEETSAWMNKPGAGTEVVLVATDNATDVTAPDSDAQPYQTPGAGGAVGSGGGIGSGGSIQTSDAMGSGGAPRGAGGTVSGSGGYRSGSGGVSSHDAQGSDDGNI